MRRSRERTDPRGVLRFGDIEWADVDLASLAAKHRWGQSCLSANDCSDLSMLRDRAGGNR